MNMCPSYKCKVPPELCLKGQVFFIWSNQHSLQVAQEQISLLGGRVDSFLSKEITTILVEDIHLVPPQYLSTDLAIRASYTANGVVSPNFTHPGIVYNLPSTSQQQYNLLASSGVSSPHRIILFARQWGIQVLGIGYFLTTIDPIVRSLTHQVHRPKRSQNISNLTGCYIKFECFHKKFRPCYKMFNNDPDRLLPLRNANILVKPENCNVILEKQPIVSRPFPFNHMDPISKVLFDVPETKPPLKVNDKKSPNRLKPKEENNYCECCRTHFNDLKTHIKSVNHQKFVANEKNYETVHNILRLLPSAQEFIQKHQKPTETSDPDIQNGEALSDMNSNSTPEPDLSMPLNLHMKKATEFPTPFNFPTKSELPLPLDLHVKKNHLEDISVPLNLHVKKDETVKNKEQFDTCEVLDPDDISNSVCKEEIDVVGSDSPEDMNCLAESTTPTKKMDVVPCPKAAGNVLPENELLEDKTNTAALAQLCLKNFDSYWLDNLPCEMDDMMFDDNIFDFDEGKQKLAMEEENDSEIEEMNEEDMTEVLSLSEVPQSPALVSGISTDIKAQSNINTSLLLESSIDVKAPCSSVCKAEESDSPTNVKTNDSPSEKKATCFSGSFDYKTNPGRFYNKAETPSCSNAKASEQMFSSDSSDDENENGFLSNVLNIITTNSDNEMKVDHGTFPASKSKSNVQCTIPENPKRSKTEQMSVSSTSIDETEGYVHKVKAACAVEARKLSVHSIASIVEKTNTTVVNEHEHFVHKVKAACAMETKSASFNNAITAAMGSAQTPCVSNTRPDVKVNVGMEITKSPCGKNTVQSNADKTKFTQVDNKPVNLAGNGPVLPDNMKRPLGGSVEPANFPQPVRENSSFTTNNKFSTVNSKDLNFLREQKLFYPGNPEVPASSTSSMALPVKTEISPVVKDENIPVKRHIDFKTETASIKTNKNSTKCAASARIVPSLTTAAVPHVYNSCVPKPNTTSNATQSSINSSTSVKQSCVISSSKLKLTQRTNPPLNSCDITQMNSSKQFCVNKTAQASPLKYSHHKRLHNKKVSIKTGEKSHVNSKENAYVIEENQFCRSSSPIQPFDTLPKRQKVHNKRPTKKTKKLPSLWSVSILPGKGLKLKFTCLRPKSLAALESDTGQLSSSDKPLCQ